MENFIKKEIEASTFNTLLICQSIVLTGAMISIILAINIFETSGVLDFYRSLTKDLLNQVITLL